MLLFCAFSLFILVLQSEDEEPDNDRQMEELQQDSNKKVTLHFINLNMGQLNQLRLWPLTLQLGVQKILKMKVTYLGKG